MSDCDLAPAEKPSLTVAVIIPTYNEKENIDVLIPRILEIFSLHGLQGSIMIVDDSSPDGTGILAKELSASLGRIIVITRQGKLGIGSAYKEGFRRALSLGFNVVIEMDADGSHDPLLIPKLLSRLEEGYDLVIGSRYIPGGEIPSWSLSRRIISRAASLFSRALFSLKTRDPTSGFRAYSVKALKAISLSDVRSDGYAFQVEMVALCEGEDLSICEIPIEFTDREVGESKLSWGEMLRFIKDVFLSLYLKSLLKKIGLAN